MRALASILLVLVTCGAVLAQVEPWAVALRPVRAREALCSMAAGRSGRCDEVGRVQAGAWTVAVVHPHERGRYLGDTTMKWHLFFERGERRFGTEQPIQHEVTVCTDTEAGFVRMGGHDSFVLEELSARDLVGAGTPEVIVRWRPTPGDPIAVHVCSVEGARPRCSGPYADGPVRGEGPDVLVGEIRIPPP